MTEDDADAPADGLDEPAPAGSPSRLSSPLLRAAVVVLVVVALATGWTAWRHSSTASVPGKGACVYAEGADRKNPKIHTVDCSDIRARYTVLSRIDHGAQGDCDRVSGADASYAATRDDKPEYVLCLALR
jgi:hypothetical protein